MVIILDADYPETEEYNKKALEYNESISEDLLRLCQPLFGLDVTVFEYAHFFKNASYIYISSHKEWYKHYIKNYANSAFIRNHINEVFETNTKYHSWNVSPDLPSEKEKAEFIISRRKFDLWHDFTQYIHHETSIEAWGFSMPQSDSKLINFFFNNLHRLEQFIVSFRSKASKIIDVPISEKIMNTGKSLFSIEHTCEPIVEKKIREFEQVIKIDKFPLCTPRGIVFLTFKEVLVLCCLNSGHQLKAIEKITGMSHNTVERCWESIKIKTQCTDKAKIIKMYKDSMLESLCKDLNGLENTK